MVGHIRAKSKCGECGTGFKDFGKGMACPTCLSQGKFSVPDRFYIEIFWNGKQRKIYSDNDGRILSSYELAQRVLTEIRQKIDKHKFDPADYVAKSYQALRFDQYCRDYLVRRESLRDRGELTYSTVMGNKYQIERYIIPSEHLAKKDIRDIRAGDIEDFRLSLPKKLKSSSQYKILSDLSSIFESAKKREDIKTIPDFPIIKPQESVKHWLDEETQEAIFVHISDRHKPIFTFMVRQGVRPGEARALQWEDVDMGNRVVTIRRTFSRTVYQDCTKTKRSRAIPLDGKVFETLKRMHVKGISGFVFRQKRNGKEYHNPDTLNWIWDTAVEKAGVTRITLYEGTRHSFASQAGNKGVELHSLQKFMGHTTSVTTEKYTHLNMEGLQRVLDVKEGKVVKLEKRKEGER